MFILYVFLPVTAVVEDHPYCDDTSHRALVEMSFVSVHGCSDVFQYLPMLQLYLIYHH